MTSLQYGWKGLGNFLGKVRQPPESESMSQMNSNVKLHKMLLAARGSELLESEGGMGDLAVSCCLSQLVLVLWERHCNQMQAPVSVHRTEVLKAVRFPMTLKYLPQMR